jgi:hypothetical protein
METNRVSEQAIRDARKEGYERRDADTRTLAHYGFWLAVILVLVLLAMKAMFFYYAKSQRLGPPASPFENARVLPPAPRLQVVPRTELRSYCEGEQKALTTYGWVDRDNGVVQIPVDRAIDLLLQRGLPARPASEGATGASSGGGQTAKTSGMLGPCGDLTEESKEGPKE